MGHPHERTDREWPPARGAARHRLGQVTQLPGTPSTMNVMIENCVPNMHRTRVGCQEYATRGHREKLTQHRARASAAGSGRQPVGLFRYQD